jgi:mRNA interferase RelE/StbE
MRRVIYHRAAIKALRVIPAKTAKRIEAKIEQYTQDSSSLAANVVRLTGRDGFRLRVGEYRVIFDDDGHVLDILAIGPRGGIYD